MTISIILAKLSIGLLYFQIFDFIGPFLTNSRKI